MRVSFNGARINLANAFDKFVESPGTLDSLSDGNLEKLNELRSNIFGFLCMYEEGDKDCKDLSETITLAKVLDLEPPDFKIINTRSEE